jgi:hypothetical protein
MIKQATKTTTEPRARRRAGKHDRCILRHEARPWWYMGSRQLAYLRRSVDSRGQRHAGSDDGEGVRLGEASGVEG